MWEFGERKRWLKNEEVSMISAEPNGKLLQTIEEEGKMTDGISPNRPKS